MRCVSPYWTVAVPSRVTYNITPKLSYFKQDTLTHRLDSVVSLRSACGSRCFESDSLVRFMTWRAFVCVYVQFVGIEMKLSFRLVWRFAVTQSVLCYIIFNGSNRSNCWIIAHWFWLAKFGLFILFSIQRLRMWFQVRVCHVYVLCLCEQRWCKL